MTDPGHIANRRKIEDALQCGPKRAALAAEVGISDSQLSKMLNGELARFCQILDSLGLAVVQKDYMSAMETILLEKLKR